MTGIPCSRLVRESFGRANKMDDPGYKWSIANNDDVNGGREHVRVTVQLPRRIRHRVQAASTRGRDLLEFRDIKTPDAISLKIPVVETFRGKATGFMHDPRARGLGPHDGGGQTVGLRLSLNNHPRFIQNLKMDRLKTPTQQIDVAALDIIRDRERGVVARGFNEFRRQYGLRHAHRLRRFPGCTPGQVRPRTMRRSKKVVTTLRDVYGQHKCDASKVHHAGHRVDQEARPINDCLGHPNGSMVDNVEDLDNSSWVAG